MKKILLFLLFPVFVSAQVGTSFNGKLNIFSSTDLGGNMHQITGLFNDENGLYSSSDVEVGDFVYVSNGASCARLRVNTINSDIGGIINADVFDVDAVLAASPTGICAIMRETPTFDYPVYVAGISQSLLSCIQTHFAILVDNVTVSGSGGGTTAVTIVQNSHGFSPGSPIVFDGIWALPTNDTMIAVYVVVDSIHEDTFTAAASGTFDTDIADGFYYQNNGTYSVTKDTVETPLFVVADGKMTVNPILGYDLLATEDLPQVYNINTLADTSSISSPNENSIALIGSSPYDSIAVYSDKWNLVIGGSSDETIFSASGSASASQSWNLLDYYLTLNGTTKSNLLYIGNGGLGIGTNDLSATRFHVRTDTNNVATFRFGNLTSGGQAQLRVYAESTLKYGSLTYYGANSASSGATGPNMAILASTGSDGIKIIAQESTGNIYFGTGGIGGANQRGIINSSGDWGFGTVSPQRRFHFSYTSSATNSVDYPRRLQLQSSGTVAAGFGMGEEIYIEDASNNQDLVAKNEYVFTDPNTGTEDLSYRMFLVKGGVLDTALTIEEDGDILIEGGIKDASQSLGTSGQVLKSNGAVIFWSDVTKFDSINVTDTINPVHTGFYKVNGNSGAFTVLLNTSSVPAGTTITIKAYNVGTNNVTIDSSTGKFIDIDADLSTGQETIVFNTTSAKNFTYDGQDWHIH